MKNVVILLLFIAFFNSNGYSAAVNEVVIKGNFPNAQSKKIMVFKYNDLITKKLVKFTETKIDSKGNFVLTFKANSLDYVFVQMDFFRVQFYVQAGNDYQLLFDTIDLNNPKFYPSSVVGFLSPNYRLNSVKPSDINKEMEQLNQMYGDFVDQNYLALRQGENLDSLTTSFSGALDSLSKLTTSKEMKENIHFKENSLFLLAHKIKREQIIATDFKGKNIQYSNKIYMDYFTNFWTGTLTKTSKFYKPSDIDSAIVKQKSLATLNSILKKDPILADTILRELVILSNIADQYYNKRFTTQSFDNILLQISTKSKNPNHKLIADNLMLRFAQMKNGEPAPNFQFIDLQDNTIQLKTFEGKYVYLYYFTTQNSESLAELEIIRQKTYDEFEDIIEFVCVSLDKNPELLKQYTNKDKYKFRICHFNSQFDFIENYHVQLIPSAVLINKKGEIENNNAPLLSQDFSNYFLKMLNDKKGNLR